MYRAARLKEPSTWRGLVWLLTACGVTLRPEVWEQITAVGMAAAGLLGVLSREPASLLPPIALPARPAAAEPVPVATAVGVLRQPPVPPRHNTDEASDVDPQRPGWNG